MHGGKTCTYRGVLCFMVNKYDCVEMIHIRISYTRAVYFIANASVFATMKRAYFGRSVYRGSALGICLTSACTKNR